MSGVTGTALIEDAATSLARQAAERPVQVALTWLNAGGEIAAEWTYADLDRRVREVAGSLLADASPGDRVVLAFPPGVEFVAAFYGCLAAGLIPVPVALPRERIDGPLRHVVIDCGARLIFTTDMVRKAAGSTRLMPIRVVTFEEVDGRRAIAATAIARSGLALLQYTSGSTSQPRGVMVTHANLAHTVQHMRRACRPAPGEAIVSWLPHFHDLGLVGTVAALSSGMRMVLLSPLDFIQRPARWLEAISRFRASLSGGPNFAYELCVQRVDEETKLRLDLSSWRVAYCGGEPIRAGTFERFSETFAACGLHRSTFHPAYGLAEATLQVAATAASEATRVFDVSSAAIAAGRIEPAAADARSVQLVGCGKAQPETRIVIVDPETRRAVSDGTIGELWVQGPTVAAGYWKRDAETRETFQARLADAPDDAFLRTGDLGARLEDGEILIAGRLKDLIIVRGQNVHPQDIEQTAEAAHAGVAGGGTIALADEHDETRIVLVAQVKRHAAEAFDANAAGRAIFEAVSQACDLALDRIVFIEPGTLPRTTSGKVQRRLTSKKLTRRELPVVETWEPRAAPRPSPLAAAAPPPSEASIGIVEQALIGELAATARVAPASIGRDTPLGALGIDSLTAIHLSARLETALGCTLPPTLIWDHADARSLATYLLTVVPDAAARLAPSAGQPSGVIAPALSIGAINRRDSGTKRMQHLWKRPTDPTIQSALEIEATPIERWLAAHPRITLEHAVIKAVATALSRHPDANARLRFGRIVPRDTVSVTAIVTASGADGRAITRNIQIERVDQRTVDDIAAEARDKAAAIMRAGLKGVDADPFKLVPNPAVRPLFALLRWCDINPGRPHFSSAVVSNLGVFGAGETAWASGYVPLTRQFPIYWCVTIAGIRRQPIAIDDRVEVRPVLALHSTFDHRIFTGALIAAVYSVVTDCLRDPDRHLS